MPTFTINLYPNPTNGKVTLEMSNYPYEVLTMKVYNILGEMIFDTPLGIERQQTFDFKRFANGLYYVKISGNKLNKIEKLLIQKID